MVQRAGLGSCSGCSISSTGRPGPLFGLRPNQQQVAPAKPQQIGRRRQLQRPEIEHPAGSHDQTKPKTQGQGQAEVEGLALTGRILQAPGDRRQGNRVVGGEHRL